MRRLIGIAFLAMVFLAGCSMKEPAREAGSGFVSGVREEAEAWWATKKPEIVAAAREGGAEAGERIVARLEATVEARAAESRAKQGRGEPLSDEDKMYLYLAVIAPFLASLAKAGLRYVRGDSAAPTVPTTPATG